MFLSRKDIDDILDSKFKSKFCEFKVQTHTEIQEYFDNALNTFLDTQFSINYFTLYGGFDINQSNARCSGTILKNRIIELFTQTIEKMQKDKIFSFINSEEFVDQIIERINKKQISK